MSIDPLHPTDTPIRFEDLAEQIWPREEIINGKLLVSPFAGIRHQDVVLQLASALMEVAPKELRVFAGVNILRRSATDRLLIPDVAVADTEAVRQATALGSAWLRPEDVFLAVEVISPSSRERDLHLKRDLYAQWKIGTYWAIDPVNHERHEFGLRPSAGTWLAEVDLTGIWLD